MAGGSCVSGWMPPLQASLAACPPVFLSPWTPLRATVSDLREALLGLHTWGFEECLTGCLHNFRSRVPAWALEPREAGQPAPAPQAIWESGFQAGDTHLLVGFSICGHTLLSFYFTVL